VTSFGIVFGGALTGMFVARRLPPHHLGEEAKTVVFDGKTVSVSRDEHQWLCADRRAGHRGSAH
jgi:hypothetical protein